MKRDVETREPLTNWVSTLRDAPDPFADFDEPADLDEPEPRANRAPGPRDGWTGEQPRLGPTGEQPLLGRTGEQFRSGRTGEMPRRSSWTGEPPRVDRTGEIPRRTRTAERPGFTRTGEHPSLARTGEHPRVAESQYQPAQPGPAQHREGEAPEPYDKGGRLFFHIVFWCALAASVELWWLNTAPGSVRSTTDILLAGGRLTGMVGGFLMLAQVLLMSRVWWLERWIGAHSLLIWHRELGGALLFMILAHVGLITVGYSQLGQQSVVEGTWSLITEYEDMIGATVATGILVATGLLAIRAVRRVMPYELWYYLHLTTYLILLLSYGHQFATGQELVKAGFGRYYWIGLYLFVVACLVWGRVITPLMLNARHRLRVERVVDEAAPGMISIYVSGRRLEDLNARAGQYFRWRFLTAGCWWQAHPFSLSAAPNEHFLRLTIKVVGDHTEQLQHLRPGVRVFIEGPSGVFTADRRIRPRALLIAGGSGIAPIRALLEDLPPMTVVIYRARNEEELVFRRELDWLAREREAQVWYVLGSRDDPAPQHLFTAKGMRELVPDVRRRDVFLCGPQGLVDTSVRALRRLRVPRRQIHLDPFEF
ncbi:ferric reductase-like transmembrane domain-containing protein [Micromonospora zhanjiangensis]